MDYKILEHKKGIIFGALDESSIAWKVAEKAKQAGAEFTLTNAPVALRMGKINELAEKCDTVVIPADATSAEDLENLYKVSMEKLGGKLDFVLHSIGMSPNVRKGKDYLGLNYDFFLKTIDISALSLHKTVQTGIKCNAFNEWGSILALTYIAAQRSFPGYGDMAEAKSLLESLARSLGYHIGTKHKLRINTVSQSPTFTTAGSGVPGFDKFFSYADKMSPLGNATADECANFCVMLFSDYTKKVTMQNLFHDGGFSSTGVSQDIVESL